MPTGETGQFHRRMLRQLYRGKAIWSLGCTCGWRCAQTRMKKTVAIGLYRDHLLDIRREVAFLAPVGDDSGDTPTSSAEPT